jgi:hypothetical protein
MLELRDLLAHLHSFSCSALPEFMYLFVDELRILDDHTYGVPYSALNLSSTLESRFVRAGDPRN